MKTVYTIGYEGASLANFLATLRLAGIQRVVDVRQLPQSRRPGFSKNVLAAALKAEDISYEHRKQLGDPKAGRDAARAGRHDEFRRIFSAHMENENSKSELHDLVSTLIAEVCVLLCYEREPKHCHRSILCDDLKKLGSFDVKHIGVQPMARSEGKVILNGFDRHAGA